VSDETNYAVNPPTANETCADEPTPVEERLMFAARRVQEQAERLCNHKGKDNEEEEREILHALFENYMRTSEERRQGATTATNIR